MCLFSVGKYFLCLRKSSILQRCILFPECETRIILTVAKWIHFRVCEYILTFSKANAAKSLNANIAQLFCPTNLTHLHKWSASASKSDAGTSPSMVFSVVPLYHRVSVLYLSSHSDLNVNALVENWLHTVMVLNWCFLYHPSRAQSLSSECIISSGLAFHHCSKYILSLFLFTKTQTNQLLIDIDTQFCSTQKCFYINWYQ